MAAEFRIPRGESESPDLALDRSNSIRSPNPQIGTKQTELRVTKASRADKLPCRQWVCLAMVPEVGNCHPKGLF